MQPFNRDNHPHLSPEGYDRLAYVRTWLVAGAPHTPDVARFNMDVGVGTFDCDTVCCIAGAICQFNQAFEHEPSVSWPLVAERAISLLGIEEEHIGYHLFLSNGYGGERNAGVTAEEAAATVGCFMETGTVAWPGFISNGVSYEHY